MKNINNKDLKLLNKLKNLERDNDILKATLKFFEGFFNLQNTLHKYNDIKIEFDFDLKF